MKLNLNYIAKQVTLLFAGLLFLNGCQSKPENKALVAKPDAALLQKTLAYHDPKGNWQKLKTRLYLSSTDAKGKEKKFEIEMDNTTGYFAHISHEDGNEMVKGVANGKEFYLLNGKTDISPEDREKYKLNPEGLKWVHGFYGYLYGLPMKLTDTSTKAVDAKTNEEIGGKTYPTLLVNYDPAVGKDNWFFYLNPENYALQGYRFNHGEPGSGEYIMLEQEVTVDGIKMPKIRKWYFNKDNKYLGTDVLLKAEPLTEHRI